MNPLFQQYGGQRSQPTQVNPAAIQNTATQVQNYVQQQGVPMPAIKQIMANKGVPAEIQNDPDQIIGYLQQNNMLNPLQRMALQLFGRR